VAWLVRREIRRFARRSIIECREVHGFTLAVMPVFYCRLSSGRGMLDRIIRLAKMSLVQTAQISERINMSELLATNVGVIMLMSLYRGERGWP